MGVNSEAKPETWRGRWITGFVLGGVIGLIAKDLGLRAVVSYWGTFAPFVLAIAVLSACVWVTRLRWLVTVAAILSGLLWIVVAFTPINVHLAKPLTRADTIAPADAIYVLASSVRPSDEPSSVALTRATRGLELFGEGLAPRILLGELPPPAGSYVRWLKQTAHNIGMAHPDDIESVGYASSTHDEAMRVAELFRARGWKRLLLVTSPTHTRRAAATFEHAGVPVVISVPAMDTDVDIVHLHRADERIFSFGFIVHEWIGLGVYHLRGWL